MSLTVFLVHAVTEIDNIWQNGTKFDRLLIREGLLYIRAKIDELWPKRSPLGPQNTEGVNIYCNAFVVHGLTERNEIWQFNGLVNRQLSYSPNLVHFGREFRDTMRRHASVIH